MDQSVVNWAIAIAGFLGGWVLKVVWDAVKTLQRDLRTLERDMPEIYVRKDDFRETVKGLREDMREVRQDMKDGFNKIDSTLGLLFKKIDGKEDKAQ